MTSSGKSANDILAAFQAKDGLTETLQKLQERTTELMSKSRLLNEPFEHFVRALTSEGARLELLELVQEMVRERGAMAAKIAEYFSGPDLAGHARQTGQILCRAAGHLGFADPSCEGLVTRYANNKDPFTVAWFGMVVPTAITIEALLEADSELINAPHRREDMKDLIGTAISEAVGIVIPGLDLVSWFFNRILERQAWIRAQMAAAANQYARLQVYRDTLRQFLEDAVHLDDVARKSREQLSLVIEDCASIAREMEARGCWQRL